VEKLDIQDLRVGIKRISRKHGLGKWEAAIWGTRTLPDGSHTPIKMLASTLAGLAGKFRETFPYLKELVENNPLDVDEALQEEKDWLARELVQVQVP
jgi:hypothetical protein